MPSLGGGVRCDIINKTRHGFTGGCGVILLAKPGMASLGGGVRCDIIFKKPGMASLGGGGCGVILFKKNQAWLHWGGMGCGMILLTNWWVGAV